MGMLGNYIAVGEDELKCIRSGEMDIFDMNPEDYRTLDMDKVTDEYKSLYEENGGNPHLDGAYSTAGTGHTVFAQVFEGMDVVREIMQVETDDNDMPLTEVTILSAEIVPYE